MFCYFCQNSKILLFDAITKAREMYGVVETDRIIYRPVETHKTAKEDFEKQLRIFSWING